MIATTLEVRRWSRRTGIIFGLLCAAGLVSLSGIVYLSWQEMSGASWRAAAVRDSVAVELNLTTEAARSSAALDRDLSGQLLLRAETTYVVALTGYHPRLLVSIAAGSVIGYLLMVVAGFAAPIIRARVERRRRDSAETEAAGGEDSGGEWEKEAVVQDDERSTQRRAHSCATPAAELSAQAWATGTNER